MDGIQVGSYKDDELGYIVYIIFPGMDPFVFPQSLAENMGVALIQATAFANREMETVSVVILRK